MTSNITVSASEVSLRNVKFVLTCYPGLANHPLFSSRSRELHAVQEAGTHYGLVISEADFDEGIAQRFGDGVEYEWPNA